MPAKASISASRRSPTRSAPAPPRWRRCTTLIAAHVLAAERLHGDDTTVPVLAKGKTDTGRLWIYVRDDRPFGGGAPPAALFRYSRDRRGEHPATHLAGWSGILQADAYAGFNGLYAPDRAPGPVTEALCWAHAPAQVLRARRHRRHRPPRQPGAADLAARAARRLSRIDAIFDIERAINGLTADARLAVRQAERRAAGRRPRGLDARASAPGSRAMPRSPRRWTTC